MLSEKHTVATPRTSAAVIITSLARKINRCPAADCNTTNTNMFPIDSESFQLCDELLVPTAAARRLVDVEEEARRDEHGDPRQCGQRVRPSASPHSSNCRVVDSLLCACMGR